MAQETETRSRSGRKGRVSIVAVLLIVLGGLLLLQTTGVLPWEVWNGIWRLWPVIIIVIGISIVFGQRMPWLAGVVIAVVLVGALGVAFLVTPVRSVVTVNSMQQSLEGIETVDVHVSFGAGELTLDSLPQDSPNLVEASQGLR